MSSRRVVSYNRISKADRTVEGESVTVERGVNRQQADAMKYVAAAELGEISRHYVDNNRSASRFRTKEREEFEALLADLEAGEIGSIVVWMLDRIIRDPADLDRLLDRCRAHDVRIHQTAGFGMTIDPADPLSVKMARDQASQAEYEVAIMSLRAKRRQEAAAEAGKSHGGRRRFGYEDAYAEKRDDEAILIEEAAQRIIRGGSLASIARDWNEAGVTTSNGNKWRGVNIRKMLLSPHIAGLRVFRGEIYGDASWDGILDRPTWEAVGSILTDPTRRSTKSTARKYMLTGLATCGTCGGRIRGRSATTSPGKKVATYVCETTRHVHRPVAAVNRVVAEYVAGWIIERNLDLTPERESDDHAERALEALRASRQSFVTEAGAEGMPLADMRAWLAGNQQKIDALAARISADLRESVAFEEFEDVETAEQARAVFVSLDLDRQREIVRTIGAVYIDPAARRGARFDESSVRLEPHFETQRAA